MSRLRTVAAGVIVAAVALLATAAPASAHDELLSSTPAAGDRLDSAPAEIALTFPQPVLDVGASMLVTDADGVDHVAGAPVLDAGTVTVPLEPDLRHGAYEVRWRVVSSDGHPLSGIIHFTVGEGEAAAPVDASASEGSAAPVVADAVSPAAASPTLALDGPVRTVLIGAVGAVLALAAFSGIHFLRRRLSAGGPGDAGNASPDNP
jgi:copper resistance protein C